MFHGPGPQELGRGPDPKLIDDTDAIVRIDTVTICGTDLHILKGDVPEVTPGRILGHEAVGTVIETGMATRSVREGDRVLLSLYLGVCSVQVLPGGAVRPVPGGRRLDPRSHDRRGAGRVARVPFADTSTYRIPEGLSDEQVLYLSDVPPVTRWGC